MYIYVLFFILSVVVRLCFASSLMMIALCFIAVNLFIVLISRSVRTHIDFLSEVDDFPRRPRCTAKIKNNLHTFHNLQVHYFCYSLSLCLKARLHRRFLSQQHNAIFVAPKLQLQNRTCKPLCDFCAILAIYRRGMRYNSRNTVTDTKSGSNRRILTFTLTNCTKIAMKSQLVATSARQKLH